MLPPNSPNFTLTPGPFSDTVPTTMILRFSSCGSGLSLAMVMASLFLPLASTGEEKQRGRQIEFSDPKSSDITTNLNQLSPKRGGLRDFEADLTKPFQKGLS